MSKDVFVLVLGFGNLCARAFGQESDMPHSTGIAFSASVRGLTLDICFLGITSKCSGATGATSLNAMHNSSSCTMSAGISRLKILPKMVVLAAYSLDDVDALRVLGNTRRGRVRRVERRTKRPQRASMTLGVLVAF